MSSNLKKNRIIIACAIALVGCGAIADRLSTSSDESSNTVREIADDYQTLTDQFDDSNAISETSSETLDIIEPVPDDMKNDMESDTQFDYSMIPDYSGEASIIIHDNTPFFTYEDMLWEPGLEVYPPLDELERCRTVYACIGKETMPAEGEERGSIGMIKPSGWQTIKYPDIIDDLYLYNRCHLIGWQLGGENDNEYNLITGTRYMNVNGMLQYEDQVANYVNNTGNHVIYRVTPVFVENELVARGVLIEAESVEDYSFHFCVWCYNVQPGIEIDYLTGASRAV